MTTGDMQSIITLIAFVIFIGIVGWAWSRRRREEFDEAARIPLDDDKPVESRAVQHEPEKQTGAADNGSGESR